jgi:hypothetical protein
VVDASPIQPGWDKNPGAWPRRIRLIVVPLVGLGVDEPRAALQQHLRWSSGGLV